MSRSMTDARQVATRALLAKLANRADYLGTSDNKPANQTELDNLLASIDAEVTPPLRLYESNTPDLVLNVGPSVVQNPETLSNKALPTIGASVPTLASGTITFPAAPGAVVVAPGNDAVLAMGSDEYIKALIYLDANNDLNLIFGAPNAIEADATVPTSPSSVISIGFVTIQTIANVVQNITNANIYQYVGTGAGGGSGGNGVLEVDVNYKMLATEDFSADPFSENSTIQPAGINPASINATFDSSKRMYEIQCDKTFTFLSEIGSPNNVIVFNQLLNGWEAEGDIVYIMTGALAGQFRRVIGPWNQQALQLSASFPAGLAPGDQIMVSQAVWTGDLVQQGDPEEVVGTRARDVYPGEDIYSILIDYKDSLVDGDDVPNFTGEANVVVSACTYSDVDDPTLPDESAFSSIFEREPLPTRIEKYDNLKTIGNNPNERLFLVFFANPNNVNVVSQCNFIGYDVNFYEDDETINGGVLDSAYGWSDNSTTTQNGTISTVSSQTRIDVNFDINPAVGAGTVASQVSVKVNGQDVPRFVDNAVTPNTIISYVITQDASGLYRRIRFNVDLSLIVVDILVIKQFGVIDASFTQSNKLLGLYDAIVGSSAQVTAGYATHSSLQDAHNSVDPGAKILLLNNVALNGNTTLSKRLMIEGKGPGSILTGDVTVASTALGSIFRDLKVNGNITFNSGADKCFMTNCFQGNGFVFTNNPANLDNVITVITE